MLKMFPPDQFTTFTSLIQAGKTIREAADASGLDHWLGTWVAAEIRNRKPIELKQLIKFEELLERGEPIWLASALTGIPYNAAAQFSNAYSKAVKRGQATVPRNK